MGLRGHGGLVHRDAARQAPADASVVLSRPGGAHGSGAWRCLVWWQALHAAATKAATPCARRASRSAPGPNRARALHAQNTDRPTRPTARTHAAPPPQPTDPTAGLPPLHLQAAGMAVGRAAHAVAVPPERSPAPVRRCARCTADRQGVADGLHACRLETVVMERPGVSWSPLGHILAAPGLEGHLGNARHAKHVPGRTTDLADGPWRPPRHPCGRLNGACRPPAARCG